MGRREAQRARRHSSADGSRATPTSSTPTRRASCASTAGRTRSTTIEHHPAMLDSKRAMWECGYVSGFASDAADRDRTTPGVVIAAAHYLVSQADTGLVCSTGMTSGVAGLVAAYAPPDVRDTLLAGLRAERSRLRDRRFDVPHRARGRLGPRQLRALCRARPRRRPRRDRRREVVLLERRRRGDRAPRPSGGRGRRVGRPRLVPRPGTSRRRRAQPLHRPPVEGQARHEERADRRGRVPRRSRLRVARAARRGTAPTHAGSTA